MAQKTHVIAARRKPRRLCWRYPLLSVMGIFISDIDRIRRLAQALNCAQEILRLLEAQGAPTRPV